MARTRFKDFKMTLNMENGLLERSFVVFDGFKHETAISVERFISIHNKNLLAISFSLTPLNYEGHIEFEPYMNGLVESEDVQGKEKILWE